MNYKTIIFLIMFLIVSFACGDEKKNLNKEFEIQIIKGQIENDLKKIKVNKGENVKFLFNTDEPLTVHLHGYDIEENISSEKTTIMEFQADATGRYRLTAHENMELLHSNHAAGFESETLKKDDIYIYRIPTDMKDGTIPYHNHMDHNKFGEIIVSSNQGLEGEVNIKIKDDDDQPYSPDSIVVKPGSIIKWEVLSDKKVRLTSGLPPTSEDAKHDINGDHDEIEGHEGHHDHDEDKDHEEKSLLILEVYP